MKKELTVIDKLVMNAKAGLRPLVRRIKGKCIALVNDIKGNVRTDSAIDEPLREQWVRVLRNSSQQLKELPPANGPKVLVATNYGFPKVRPVIESILLMALRVRGVRAQTLVCDKSLPACEFNNFGNHQPPPGEFAKEYTKLSSLENCRACTENITDSYDLLPIERFNCSRFVQPGDLEKAIALVDSIPYENYGKFIYRDIAVGEEAKASTIRVLRRGILDDDEHTRFLFRRYLLAAIMATDQFERALNEIKPDRIVCNHGIYVTHGVLLKVSRKLGIDIIIYGFPYRQGTIWLSHNDTYHRTLTTEPPAYWENIILSSKKKALVDDYLSAKRLGGRDYIAYNTKELSEPQAIAESVGLSLDKPIVSIFTNVLWDAQLFYDYNVFDNMIEWIFETIRYFERRPDLQLAIRVHPAEARGVEHTNQPLKGEIIKEFPVLPPNVKVIPGESKVNSYSLAEISCAALIYGARMGVEIATLGTPLIIAGETFNRRKGFSYDAENRQQYFEFLDALPNLPKNDRTKIERARHYAYHFLYRIMIDFPLFHVKNGYDLAGARLNFDSIEELKPGKSASLDLICNGIIEGKKPFIFDDPKNE